MCIPKIPLPPFNWPYKQCVMDSDGNVKGCAEGYFSGGWGACEEISNPNPILGFGEWLEDNKNIFIIGIVGIAGLLILTRR